MSLPIVDAQGRIYVTPEGTPVRWSAGLGYTADGRLCTTTTVSANDRTQSGLRRSNDGLLVVGDGVAAARPYFYNWGIPTDKQSSRAGVVIRQTDTVPAATDPYVGGVRIGPLGGVYTTTAAIGVVVSAKFGGNP